MTDYPGKKRRRMKKFRLDEISLVDRPAQAPARVAILKRQADAGDVQTLVKAESLTTSEVDGHTHTIRLTRRSVDEGGTGGETVSAVDSDGERHTHAWVITPEGDLEIGEAAGHKHEVPAAQVRAAIRRLRRVSRDEATPDVAKQLGSKMAVTTPADGHSHKIVLVQAGSEGLAELRSGQTSFADGHVHDWVMDDAGNIVITDVNGHSHGIGILVTKAEDMEDEVLTQGVLAALGSDDSASGNKAAEAIGDSREVHMTKQNDQAADQNTPAVTPEQHAELQKRADRAEAVVSLPADQRAHFDGLDSKGQDEFLAKSADERAAVVKNAREADPVVFEDPEAGIVLRKSADPVQLALAKQAKDAREELARERALRKRDELIKRAGEVLKNCQGSQDAKAALLGAVEGIQDETLRKQALEILKAKDAGLQKAFTAVGTSDSNGGEGADPHQQIETIAKSIREKRPELTPEQAYSAALDTPEGREAFAQTRS